MRTSFDARDKNDVAERNSRWPEIDVWFVVVVLIALSILALFTFEIWIPHPFSH